ncbi:hypothetical protein ALC60_02664 [Trachymyrmex zeteki]|uniref:Uncharacterized protein n=1 Tax=Mycetomoellerius zeteki TaxID=64791 RepID=A0A151XCY8_9HYME|nr:hypothetical protein ALC60_02664 [Trachymyrmex zeteki]
MGKEEQKDMNKKKKKLLASVAEASSTTETQKAERAELKVNDGGVPMEGNREIFDAFGGRSTMAQEVSKSTEVRYTTLQLRAHASMQFTRTRGRLNCQLRDSINNATQRRIPPSRVPRFSFYQRP